MPDDGGNVIKFPDRKPADAVLVSFDGDSSTTEDGRLGLLHAEQEDGSEVLIAFPHEQLALVVEACARELGKARAAGTMDLKAFECTGFEMIRTTRGQIMMTLHLGEEGSQLDFLIPENMPGPLVKALEAQVLRGGLA